MRCSVPALTLLSFLGSGCTSGGGGGGKDVDPPGAPRIELVVPAGGTVGTSVTISGADFGVSQGTSTLLFDGVLAAVQSWGNDEIVASVPSGAFPGNRSITVDSLAGTSNAAPFLVALPRSLYVNDDINPNNSIEGLLIAANGGATVIAGSPWLQSAPGPGYSGYGGTLALDGARRRVLTTANATLYAWDIDPAVGTLSTSSTLVLTDNPFPYGAVISPNGTRAFVGDYSGRIFAASLSSSGVLSAVAGSPFAAGTAGVSGLALSMDGGFLYANNDISGALRGFLVGASGAIAELPGSPYTQAGTSNAFERAPNADRYYVSVPTFIAVYQPNGGGELTENAVLREAMPGTAFLAFSGDGARLFAQTSTQLFVFDVSPTGELAAVSNSPFTVGVASAGTVRTNADGSLVMVKAANDECHLYTIDAAGAPTEVAGSPFALRATGLGSGAAFTF